MNAALKDAILEMRAAAVLRRCRDGGVEVPFGFALHAVRTLDDTRAYQICRTQGTPIRGKDDTDGASSFFSRLFGRVWGQPVQGPANRG